MENKEVIPNEGILISTNFESRLQYKRNGDLFECTVSNLKEISKHEWYSKVTFLSSKNNTFTINSNEFYSYLEQNNYSK